MDGLTTPVEIENFHRIGVAGDKRTQGQSAFGPKTKARSVKGGSCYGLKTKCVKNLTNNGWPNAGTLLA
jgi:hypothetical protein